MDSSILAVFQAHLILKQSYYTAPFFASFTESFKLKGIINPWMKNFTNVVCLTVLFMHYAHFRKRFHFYRNVSNLDLAILKVSNSDVKRKFKEILI